MRGSWHASCPSDTYPKAACAPRRRPAAPPGGFIPHGSPYLGQAIPGEPLCQSDVLLRTGDRRDETSIGCSHAAPLAVIILRVPAAPPRIWWKPVLYVRNETERRAAPVTPEDQLIQSMPDASPAKWHRAHTTWFFEQFLLGEHGEGYRPFHPDYAFLFNSYYVSAGPRHPRHQRGHAHPSQRRRDHRLSPRMSTPPMVKFLDEAGEDKLAAIAPLVEVGLESRAAASGVDRSPTFCMRFAQTRYRRPMIRHWRFPASLARAMMDRRSARASHTIGHAGDNFHFDNEKPAHRALVGPVQARAHPRHQCRVARLHGGRRLHEADALADGRLRRRRARAMAGARPLAPRSTANGR